MVPCPMEWASALGPERQRRGPQGQAEASAVGLRVFRLGGTPESLSASASKLACGTDLAQT